MLDTHLPTTQPTQKPQAPRPAAAPQPSQSAAAAPQGNVTEPEAPLPHDADETAYQPDDLSIAEDLTRDWKGKREYFHYQWHRYAGGFTSGYWEKVQVETIQWDVSQFLKQYRLRGIKVNSGRITGVERVARLSQFTPDNTIIAAAPERARYINHQGGMYDLRLHHTEAARPELYFTYQLPFKHDPKAKCPAFEEYLRTTFVHPNTTEPDIDLAWLVLEAMGYSLTGDTNQKAAFWLIGESNSGKSTFLWLLDQLAHPMYTVAKLNELNDRFMLATLIDKRIVVCSEASTNAVLEDSVFKMLTGGEDLVYADVKHKDPIVFKPEAHLWWAMNKPLIVKDRSNATYNRIKPIPFNRVFTISSDIKDRMKGEMAGIFNMVMLGYVRLIRNGKLTEPAQSRAKLQEWRDMDDYEAMFLKECCVRDSNAVVKASDLYAAYNGWTDRNNIKGKKTITHIADDWKRLGLVRVFRNDGSYWQGVKIKPFF